MESSDESVTFFSRVASAFPQQGPSHLHSGQDVFSSLVRRVSDESKPTLVTLDARILSRSRQMNLSERITMDPEICHGKPTILGLRYTVETILELF